MTPRQFCQHAMVDYERQWAAAAGHQERHPLRVKMAALEKLAQEAGDDPEAFGQLLSAGCGSDDPVRVILCDELLPRWQQSLKDQTRK